MPGERELACSCGYAAPASEDAWVVSPATKERVGERMTTYECPNCGMLVDLVVE